MKMTVFMVFVVLVHAVSQHASGVELYEGVESVLLPCQVPRSPEDPIVVWSRLDLNPTTIHQLQDKKEVYVQNQRYSGQTSMSADALDTGDFSLTLIKPHLFDSGNYTCSISNREKELKRIDVQLQVKEPYIFPTEAWVLLVLVVVLVVALGLAVHVWFNTITVSQVEVEEGVKSVKLPFKTKDKLPDDVTVEWSCSAPETMRVHVYMKGGDHLLKMSQLYSGRTKINEEPLKTGDLSLTLKKPCCRDSGTYICTVHRDREILEQKVVQLRVKVQGVVVAEEWAESVTVPFKTTAQLPEDATVEWRRSEPVPMIVHWYQNSQDQPDKQDVYYHERTKMSNDPLRSKDLSVTIYNTGFSDRGTYICTVHRDGVILAKKEVLVQFKVSVKAAKLHCQITDSLLDDATVEWSRCDAKPIMVHVYQNGQDQLDKQDKLYKKRTKMVRDLLKTGGLSLTLRNPNKSDNGVYICTVHKDGHIRARKVVLLKTNVHQVEVQEGTQSVQLPFQSSVQLPEDATVEWSRCEPKPMKVHVYVNGRDQPGEQDEFYQGRTMITENLLETGELSLTLTNPTDRDSDYYICTVRHKDGDIMWQNVVQLDVKEQEMDIRRQQDHDETDDTVNIPLIDITTVPV